MDGDVEKPVLSALSALKRTHETVDGDFMVPVDAEELPFDSTGVTIVVTNDASRRHATDHADAAAVLLYCGDVNALTFELECTLRLTKAACFASPYRKLLEDCPVPIFVKSTEGRVLYSNAASRAEPEGHAETTPSKPAPAAPSSETRVVERVEQWSRPNERAQEDGFFVTQRERAFRKTTSALTDLGDGTQVVMGVVADVSKDQAVRDELTQELDLMRGLLDALPSLVLVTDENDCIVLLNPSLGKVLGQEPQSLLGVCVEEAMSPEAMVAWRAAAAEARASNREVRYESESTTPDGQLVAHNGTARATVGPSGQQWILTVAIDVSELRRAQREAENATRAAVDASRIKSQFLANMSHEIRTPMNGVLGMLELALGTPLNSEQREYLEAAHMSAESLLTIINDILDISKIEAGKLSLETIPFALSQVVDGLTALRARAREKGLRTTISVDKTLPDRFSGDPVRFRQILVNLVGNAIKFTKEGGVDVRVFPEPEEKDMVHVVVSDTGIGIPKEQQAHVFDAFRQADGTTTRKFGGTGLGLSICQQLCALMGGRIWVESEPGCGSSFHFTARLPATTAVPKTTAVAHAPLDVQGTLARKMRVLLVEDNTVGAKFAMKLLELLGCEATHSWDGQQAVDAATTHDYDLILMDMQMPVMDGLEATMKIRAHETAKGKPRTPIHALTANAMKGDAETCTAAGMDGHLAKPLEKELLRQLVLRIGGTVARNESDTEGCVLDLDKALERCGGDRALLAEVAVAFAESFASNSAVLQAGAAAKDGVAVFRAAHALKGVFVYVCADRAARLAQALCKAGKDNDSAHYDELVSKLMHECIEVNRRLAEIAPAATSSAA